MNWLERVFDVPVTVSNLSSQTVYPSSVILYTLPKKESFPKIPGILVVKHVYKNYIKKLCNWYNLQNYVLKMYY